MSNTGANPNRFEISLGDVTDMQAHVYARYTGPEAVVVRGELRGPFCEIARTLPADFPFRDLAPERAGSAEAIVTDPCLWSPEPRSWLYSVRRPEAPRTRTSAARGLSVVE